MALVGKGANQRPSATSARHTWGKPEFWSIFKTNLLWRERTRERARVCVWESVSARERKWERELCRGLKSTKTHLYGFLHRQQKCPWQKNLILRNPFFQKSMKAIFNWERTLKLEKRNSLYLKYFNNSKSTLCSFTSNFFRGNLEGEMFLIQNLKV